MTEQDRVLACLRQMAETEIHTKVVLPLLRQQGATDIQYVHGPSEKGKDFVYLRHDPFHSIDQLEVMQVKNQPFTGRAGSDNTIAVLSQLIQCRETEVRHPLTNSMERPSGVVLLSTYELPQKDVTGAGQLLDDMRRKGCIFIGPEKFVDRIKRFLPNLYADYAFPGGGLYRAIRRFVNLHHEAPAFDIQPDQQRPLTAFFVNLGLTQTGRVMHKLALGDVCPRSPSSVRIERKVYEALTAQYETLRQRLADLNLFELEGADRQPDPARKDAPHAAPSSVEGRQERGGGESLTTHIRLNAILFEEFVQAVQTYLRPIQSRSPETNDRLIADAIQLLNACDRFVEVLSTTLRSDAQIVAEGASRPLPRFDLPEVPPSALLAMSDHLYIVGEAGAGKTSVARELARLAIDQNVPCVYFPCARLDSSKKTLTEEVLHFLRELTGSTEAIDASTLQNARLLILDGLDEAACDPSVLGQDIATLAFPKAIREKVTSPPGYPPVIPKDLQAYLKYSKRTQTEGFLVQSSTISSGDFDRLIELNKADAFEKPLRALATRGKAECPRLVVTARDHVLTDNRQMFVQVRLTPFSDEQQKQFFLRWFSNAPEDADAILAFLSVHPHIRDVCRTPIIATMVAALHQNGYDLPLSRTDVYTKRFELLLERWDKARGVTSRNRVNARDKLTFLQRIALNLHRKHKRRFSHDLASQAWQAGFSRHYPGIDVDDLLWELQVCNSLIMPDIGDTYSLGHLSYQEYLAARGILHSQQLTVLRDRFYDPYWRQVALFYAGISGDVTKLLRSVQQKVPLANQGGLLDELMAEARHTPEVVKASILDKEFGATAHDLGYESFDTDGRSDDTSL